MRFEAAKQDDKIVLTNTEDKSRKWVFVKIEDKFFIGRMLQLKRMASGLLISIYMPSAPDQYKCFDSLV